MRKIETTGQIKGGVLKIAHRDKFMDVLSTWKDCSVNVIVQKQYKKRSNEQNGYYWGCIVPYWKEIMYEEWGEFRTDKEVHSFLKSHFNTEEKFIEKTGEIINVEKSTTKNTTVEQEIFHETCRQKAYEMFNVMIPLPGEQLEMQEL